MTNKGLVSIIVPVYNTNPILMQKCFDSIFAQTYKNIEVVIVDDGSTNAKTVSFIDEIKDIRKRTIRTKNNGVSHARNIGLEKSKGDFVVFIDSDDYVDKRYIEHLLNEDTEKYAAIFSGKTKVNSSHKTPECGIKKSEYRLPDDVSILTYNTLPFCSQGALMKSGLAKKHKFNQELAIAEDAEYMEKVLRNKRFLYLANGEYYYVRNINSAVHGTSRKETSKYLQDFIYVLKKLAKRYGNNNDVANVIAEKCINVLHRLAIDKNINFREYIIESKYIYDNYYNIKIQKYTGKPHQILKKRLFAKHHFACLYFVDKVFITIKGKANYF